SRDDDVDEPARNAAAARVDRPEEVVEGGGEEERRERRQDRRRHVPAVILVDRQEQVRRGLDPCAVLGDEGRRREEREDPGQERGYRDGAAPAGLPRKLLVARHVCLGGGADSRVTRGG